MTCVIYTSCPLAHGWGGGGGGGLCRGGWYKIVHAGYLPRWEYSLGARKIIARKNLDVYQEMTIILDNRSKYIRTFLDEMISRENYDIWGRCHWMVALRKLTIEHYDENYPNYYFFVNPALFLKSHWELERRTPFVCYTPVNLIIGRSTGGGHRQRAYMPWERGVKNRVSRMMMFHHIWGR